MLKIVMVSVLLAAGLSACGCLPFIPRVVACYDVTDLELPPVAMTFQKDGQWGHTDYEQRKEDMIECGILRERYKDNLYDIGGTRPGETMEQFWPRREKFLQCMHAKGYHWLGLEECGPVKENRGICK
jgi:hypothetical protein